MEGGITHWGPDEAGVVNAIEDKVDWTVKSNAAGSVMAKWLPDVQFIDMSGSPAGGMFQPGQQCNGCVVLPRLGPANYLVQVVLPKVFPNARDVRLVTQSSVPGAEAAMDRLRAALNITLPIVYSSSLVAVDYTEGGTRYRQLMFVIIEDMAKLGLGLWKSRSTIVFRAPIAAFGRWLPTLQTVNQSVSVNPKWLIAQMKAADERTGSVAETMWHSRVMNKAILDSRQEATRSVNEKMQRLLIRVK